MNIFASYECPVQSSLALDDKRVNKMIVESAQMLSTALWRYDAWESGLYKPCYVNHPCNDWVRKSRKNFEWLCEHAFGLCYIYTSVFKREHKTEAVLKQAYYLQNKIPKGSLTEFANCTPYKLFMDNRPVTERYRQYLNEKWSRESPTFRNRKTPEFFNVK